MNKTGQSDWEEIIKLVIFVPVIIAVLGALVGISKSNCPSCDCSQYSNQLRDCIVINQNLTKQLNETPIKYIQNTSYINVSVEKVIYKEKPIFVTLNILAIMLSLGITVTLFGIRLRLPKEIEDRLKKIEKIILWVKISSLVLSILLLIRLILAFLN